MEHISGKRRNSSLFLRSQTALALGVILGGASLFIGQAKAATTTTVSCQFNGGLSGTVPPDPVPACNGISDGSGLNWTSKSPNQFQLGDKLFSFLGLNSPSSAGGHVEFTWFDLDGVGTTYGDDTWSVSTIFDDPVVNENGYIDYTLQVVDPGLSAGWHFDGVKLDSTVQSADGVKVEKFINDPEHLSAYLTSTVGSADPTTGFKPLGGTFITVRDQWTVASDGALSDMVNTYTQSRDGVPGPLPLLGAGAAFGFSRRIRSQIKGVRLV